MKQRYLHHALAVTLAATLFLGLTGCAKWHDGPMDTPAGLTADGHAGGANAAALRGQHSSLATPPAAGAGNGANDGAYFTHVEGGGEAVPSANRGANAPYGAGSGAGSGASAGASGGSPANAPVNYPANAPAGSATGYQGDAGLTAAAGELAAMRVYFAFNSWQLRPEARQNLARAAQLLTRYPSLGVRINGHCDYIGSDEYNFALGERRARAAYTALVQNGVHPSQLEMATFGKIQPAAAGGDAHARALNRRDEFIVLAPRR